MLSRTRGQAPPARRRGTRRLWLAGVGAATALGLSSCMVLPFWPSGDSGAGGGSPRPSFTPQTPPSGTTGLDSYYAQRLDWTSCGGGAECARLSVPQDYAKPAAGSIQLAVLRVPARSEDERVGAVVVNPGGPGASGVSYARTADQIVGRDVRDRMDVVGFDPRGVARSEPVDCLDDPQMDVFLGQDPTPDTPAEESAFLQSEEGFGRACQASYGPLLADISTLDTAKDLDILRAALGEPKLTYLGKSYGTLIGQVYAELHPALVDKMVLDGVVNPADDRLASVIAQATGFERATKAYLQDCVDNGDCPAGDSVEQGLAWITEFLQGLDAHPLPVTGDQRVTELTEGWASYSFIEAMYDRSFWSMLTDALNEATSGSGDGLMKLANMYAYRTSGGQYTTNLLEAFQAVSCTDDNQAFTAAQIEADIPKIAAAAPTYARSFGWSLAMCNAWPVPGRLPPHPITAKGSAPIVVVGTTRDPATPYESAVAVSKTLDNAVLITYDGDGHTAYTNSNQCVNQPIDQYLLTGAVPQDGLHC